MCEGHIAPCLGAPEKIKLWLCSYLSIVSNGDDDPGGSVEEKMFGRLGRLIEREVEDTQVRSPRSLALIFKTLQSLGEKFSGEITRRTSHLSFPGTISFFDDTKRTIMVTQYNFC